MNLFVRMLAVGAVAGALVSCGGGGGGGGGGITGTTTGGGGGGTTNNQQCSGGNFCMSSGTFFPDSINVTAGSTVVWNNSANITHNVTFDDPTMAGSVNGGASGNIPDHDSGQNSRLFSRAEIVHFHCTIHGPSMHGTIIVQ